MSAPIPDLLRAEVDRLAATRRDSMVATSTNTVTSRFKRECSRTPKDLLW